MDQVNEEFGQLNPDAPAALSSFAFLIGRWQGEARIHIANREWQVYTVAWVGRYILDGYTIADEYRMTALSGELVVLGMNFRTFDVARQRWTIKWLNALSAEWTDLVSEESGGVRFDGRSVSYAFKEPVAEHAYTRATYTSHSADHFTWIGDKSDDGETWSEFMVVACHRTL